MFHNKFSGTKLLTILQLKEKNVDYILYPKPIGWVQRMMQTYTQLKAVV